MAERHRRSSSSANVLKRYSGVKVRFVASMVLTGAGDALGYNNAAWEFNKDGTQVHQQFESAGGMAKFPVKGCKVSDDTVMSIATAEALTRTEIKDGATGKDLVPLWEALCERYCDCFSDMQGRAPGPTTMSAVNHIRKNGWSSNAYDRRGGGCGGAMRAMPIGLRFPAAAQADQLVAAAVESSRMTHNHPTGIFGGVAAAQFTAYALQGVPVADWGALLLAEALPAAKRYMKADGRWWSEYQADMAYFETAWAKYLTDRGIAKPGGTAKFPARYGVTERDAFYTSVAFAGWGGASGHDAPLIAYDALLGAAGSWPEFVLRGVLHGGDNDSTGAIGAAWFGAVYGFDGVPAHHVASLEYCRRLEDLGTALFDLAGSKVVAS